MAPTLVALRTALPPEGALRLRPGKAGSAALAGQDSSSLTLVASQIAFAIATFLALTCSAVQAESVALAGMLGSKALLVVDGTAPKTVAAGETHRGVKVLSTTTDEAVVEQLGKRRTLRVGEAPVNMASTGGGAGKGNRIVLQAGAGGHFMTAGQINGKAVQFMVDTGATTVAMGAQEIGRAHV